MQLAVNSLGPPARAPERAVTMESIDSGDACGHCEDPEGSRVQAVSPCSEGERMYL